MIRNLYRLGLGAFLATALALACMNIEFAPTFVPRRAPGPPLQSYLEGNLGVVRGDYFHFYQFIAYRHLTGLGLSERDRDSLAPQPSNRDAWKRPSGFDRWNQARNEVRPRDAAPEWRHPYKEIAPGSWQTFLNCPEHAFQTAAQTLRERIEQFGAGSPEVNLWLNGQDAVFDNCANGENIPEPLGSDAPPLLRQDRTYQIAAARFYAGHFDQAALLFEAIAKDADSPWAKWGQYLAARCWIRKGTLVEGEGKFDRSALEEAARRLRLVLDDPQAAHIHRSARQLLGYVSLRLDPEARAALLAQMLTSQTAAEPIGQAWIDFDYLYDRGHGRGDESDLGLWMAALRGESNALNTALTGYRRNQQPHWLFAALSLIDPQHPEVAALLDAAAAVPETHPGSVSLAFHRFRLLIERGADDEARRGLDRLLENPRLSMPASSRNQLLSLRFGLSRELEEALRFAPRQPAYPSFRGSQQGSEPYLDEDSLIVFNTALTLEMLEKAAGDRILPENIRKELSLAVWVRAVLLSETETALRLVSEVEQHWPELGPDLRQYAAAETPEQRHFAAVYLLLRNPGMQPHLRESLHRAEPLGRIDDFRENWWCGLTDEEPMHESGYFKRSHRQDRSDWDWHTDWPHPAPPVRFLSPRQRDESRHQLEKLQSIPTAPNYLVRETLAWADGNADDPRVPHALHLAVRATRYGCEDRETTRYSRRAFQFLHRRYPNSEWAKATKYYY